MFFFFLLLFILFPVAEVMVFAKVAARIGIWEALGLLFFSAVFGSYLANVQGRIALERVQRAMMEGRPPTAEMLDGLLVFLGGVLFIIPGFISDIFGLLLVFPLTRWLIRLWVQSAIRMNLHTRQAQSAKPSSGPIRPELHKRDNVEDAEIVE